jgi:hypothetical protein
MLREASTPVSQRAGCGAGEDHAERASARAFRAMEAVFARALRAESDAVCESDFRFAGRGVRMRVVGRRLMEHLSRPFEHLGVGRSASAPRRLTIDLWDEGEARVSRPPERVGDDLGRSWLIEGGLLTVSPGGRFVRYERPGSVAWLDRSTERIVGWYASAEQLSVYERTKPLRIISSLWYHDQDVEIVHAGLIARDGRGVLIGGPSRAGKSTTALACLGAGFGYLGEDFVGLEEVDGLFTGYSLYGSVRLEHGHLERWFPDLAGRAVRADEPDQDKSLLLLSSLFPARLEPRVTIRAVALPRVVDIFQPRLRPASKAEALLRLAPGSLFLGLPSGARGWDRLARLVECVPSYWVELGADLQPAPRLVQQILNGTER